MPVIIKDKNQNDLARFNNLLGYVLDRPTLDYIENHYMEWMIDPSLFDNKLKSSQLAFIHGTRAVSAYLDTEQDNV